MSPTLQDQNRLVVNHQRVAVEPAPSGVSGLQERYRRGLSAIAALVGLVLLVACTNVGNLMIARTAARGREMALRVSLGAGRGRLVQLVLAESAWIAVLAALIGTGFALAAGPYLVARVNPPGDPAHLVLQVNWRTTGFVVLVTAVVASAFGLASALVALRVSPADALRGGHTPRTHRRLMHGLVFAQVAFCFVVVFVGTLFVATLTRLAEQPLGFSPDGLIAVHAMADEPQPPAAWEQLRQHLGELPGVNAATLGDRALLDGDSWNTFISIDGARPTGPVTFLRAVSPGWLGTMGIPILAGRDLRADEEHAGAAVVNETFARTFFDGQNPVGRAFNLSGPNGTQRQVQIVGLTRDARYRNLRDPLLPVGYVPIKELDENGGLRPLKDATYILRVASTSSGVISRLRQEVARVQPAIHVSTVRTQGELVRMHTIRERLLAVLGGFFAALALLLSAVGLSGVLDYAVVQRRRDIGICLALGAPIRRVVRMTTGSVLLMALAGSGLGLLLGLASERYVQVLLFEVRARDPLSVGIPVAIVMTIIALAFVPAVRRAVRTDLTATIRAQ